jgi:hypothetical protein
MALQARRDLRPSLLTLVEAVELTALVAKRDPKRHRRYAARWLWRYLGESEQVTIDDAAVAVGLLLAPALQRLR